MRTNLKDSKDWTHPSMNVSIKSVLGLGYLQNKDVKLLRISDTYLYIVWG